MALAWLVTERVREGATLLTRDEMESMVLYVLKTVEYVNPHREQQ